jgi:hypothetical protein
MTPMNQQHEVQIEEWRAHNFCGAARILITAAILFSLAAQFAISSNFTNGLSSIAACLGGSIAVQASLRPEVMQRALLPSFATLGCGISLCIGPLVYQTINWLPISENLEQPSHTFISAALFSTVIGIALQACIRSETLLTTTSSITYRYLLPTGIYHLPPVKVIWALGFTGLVALVLSSEKISGTAEYGNVTAKILVACGFLAYSPYLLPLKQYFQTEPSSPIQPTRLVYKLIFYTVVLVFIGFLKNSRSIFSVGLFSLGCGLFAFAALGKIPLVKEKLLKYAPFIWIAILLAPLMGTLSDAMVIARNDRTEMSANELVAKTIEMAFNSEALQSHQLARRDKAAVGEYSEYYVDNPYLSRFILVKFLDNMLSVNEVQSGAASTELARMTLIKLLAQLPTPALSLIGSDINKKDLEFSFGDYMYYLEHWTGLGYYRVGSPIAHGIGIFGATFYLLAVPLYLFYFSLLNLLCAKAEDGRLLVSPV